MVHHWLTPDKISAKKRTTSTYWMKFACAPVCETFLSTCDPRGPSHTPLKTLFPCLRDEQASLFFNFLPCCWKTIRGTQTCGVRIKKPGWCAEQSTVTRYARGLLQARGEETNPSLLRPAVNQDEKLKNLKMLRNEIRELQGGKIRLQNKAHR